MTVVVDRPTDEFLHLVRDALRNFYDAAYLETHPLAEHLLHHLVPADTRALALREILSEAIEALKPEAGIPFSRPEWWPYRILRRRYIEGAEVPSLCDELSLGRTAFYQYHRQGLDAVASILWRRYGERQGDRHEDVSAKENRLREELARAQAAATTAPLHLSRLFSGVAKVAQPLLDRAGLVISCCSEIPSAAIPGRLALLLRQALLALISEASDLAVQGSKLGLCANQEGDQLELVLSFQAARFPMAGLTKALEELQPLMELCQGDVQLERCVGNLWHARCRVPLVSARISVLIVDDDLEAIDLYRRYLAPRNYVIQVAATKSELEARLSSGLPDLILLDILMPGEDGWDVLRTLKARPDTRHIPVLVCSVLSQPRLALALGAAQVLQKPISPQMLLEAVDACLSS